MKKLGSCPRWPIFDFDVNDKQHAELLAIVHSVSQTGSKAIEEPCAREINYLAGDKSSE